MRIGVVIPARNEAANLPLLLATLGEFRDAGDRVAVADDSSEDDSAEVAGRLGVPVLRPEARGRGQAVGAGVQKLGPEVDLVLVLHADMRLSPGTRDALVRAVELRPDAVGGCLGHCIEDPRFRFRVVERGNRLRARWLGLSYGDQAQFFRSAALERVGGFPTRAFLEDLELALRLRRAGPVIHVGHPVRIPSRHWSRGVVRTTLRNWWTVSAYLLGVDTT